jgi:hypothetical protein
VTVMKRGIFISMLVFAVALTLSFLSSAAYAESRKDVRDVLASEIHLETYSPGKAISADNEGQHRRRTPLRELLVPLKEGVKAFCNFTPPVARGLETINSRVEYRAVIGFHFRLR